MIARLSRTRTLVLAAGLALAITTGTTHAANTEEGGYEVIANAFGFGVDIPGCDDASKNIREIVIDELNIDVREMTTGLDVEYRKVGKGYPQRLYAPGAARWGSARFTSACTRGGSKELQACWQEAASGESIRKNITVTLFKSDKSPGRSYLLLDTYPTQWSSVDLDTDGDDQIDACEESITVQIGSGAIIAHAGTGRVIPGTANGFTSSLTACEGCENTERDDGWEIAAGGAQQKETNAMTFGRFLDDSVSPLEKAQSCGEVRLRGPMTTGRDALVSWINETVAGKPWKRDFTITELLSVAGAVKPGKSYTYVDGFPVGYVFPRMSVTNTTGNTREEVRLKFIRCELK
jgi:hypothetical protein